MENPYAPPANAEQNSSKRFSFQAAIIFAATTALVLANYFTAFGYPVGLVDLFMHVCFLISPFALAMHANNLRRSLFQRECPRRSWTLLLLSCIPVSFVLSLTPYYSQNQYEGFHVMNRFFGPYGWLQWTWLLFLGLIPFAMLSKRIRSSMVLTSCIAVASILAHAHNAFYVLMFCHMSD